MRDAFGGAFSIQLMLIFLVLYVCFICVAINYARAFRVKNRIINVIEQQEGYNSTAEEQIQSYLINAGYHVEENEVNGTQTLDGNRLNNVICTGCTFYEPGYSIAEISSGGSQKYYHIETYMVFTLPVVNVHIPIAVRGETRVIEIMP